MRETASGRGATAEDVQGVENVLRDTVREPFTRGVLLKRAAAGALAAGALGSAGSALAARSQGDDDTVDSILTTAVTAEALAVTFLTEAVKRSRGELPASFVEVLAGANRSEFLHYQALQKAGGRPLTTRFWIPEGMYGQRMDNVFRAMEATENVFVNAYLLGITVFAREQQPTLARYAGEILGVEAEHRVMARQARDVLERRQGRPGFVPNNRGFQTFRFRTTGEHVAELERLGVGFGKQGKAPGKFYEFPGDPLQTRTGFTLVAPFAA